MAKDKPTLYVIDGHSYIYRAFHAIRNLSSSRGLPTNAVYGFTTMLLKVLSDNAPDYVAVCFDPKGPTKRHEMYDKYKANRPPMPETLRPQVPYIHKVVEAMNIPVLVYAGVEADDVIAGLANRARDAGMDVTIVSGDKDLMQLISGGVRVYDTMKEIVYGPEECEKKFGVTPELLTDLLGLMGDSSDNIPGVPGVGQKTAAKLIAEFGPVESVIENADRIKTPKLRKNIKEHAGDALLSKRLVTLMDGLPDGVELESLRRRDPDEEALLALFRELEFDALIGRVSVKQPAGPEVEAVRDGRGLDAMIRALRKAGSFSVGIYGDEPSPMRADIVGMSFACGDGGAYYLPLGHMEPGSGGLFPERVAGQLSADEALAGLGPLLADPDILKCAHDAKAALVWLSRAGVEAAGFGFDTMVAAYLINPGRAGNSLESAALEHTGRRLATREELCGTGMKKIRFSEASIDDAAAYAGAQAAAVYGMTGVLTERLENGGLLGLFRDMEMPLVRILAGMELEGVHVDAGYLRGISGELGGELAGIQKRIYESSGGEFNINSPKQLAEILFDKLGLAPARKTKTGFSTDEEVLRSLALEHPLPGLVLDYRELFKLKSTYVDALIRLVHPDTGRVHTTFNQTVTATGRLSSSDPNLQNIPIRTDMGRRIRRAFAAPEGMSILSADYSQIELRIMASLSEDPSFTESFINGEDIHTRTASEIFRIAKDAVTPEMRRHAKAINFGIMYGMGAYGLANSIGVSPAEASRYIDAYFERHAGVKEFIDKNLEEVKRTGYSTTLFGRRRAIPELASDSHNVRMQGERLAVNTPIQGTAADVIKIAMIRVDGALRREGLASRMVLQVHDELVFEGPVSEAKGLAELVRNEMEHAVELKVPVKVDVGYGPNWDEAH